MPKDIRTETESWRQTITAKKNQAGVAEDIRTKRQFLAGYKQGNVVIVPGYSAEMSLKQLISLFSKLSNLRQQGALAWEIEHQILKQSFKPRSEKFSILFRETAGVPSQTADFDHKASQQLSPQGLLLNLFNDGFGGRCDPLSKLVLVAKYLESNGQQGVTRVFLERLYIVASITNSPAHYSTLTRDNAEQLVNRLKEIHSNTAASYNYDTLRNIQYHIVQKKWSVADNNAIGLQQVINKLISGDIGAENDSTGDENVVYNSVLLALDAPEHAMAAWARTEDNQRMYGFYDPNAGVVEFSSAAKFKQYLAGFFGKQGLNMAAEYRLPNNTFGQPIFSCVTVIDGSQLANFKPYKNLSNPITLEQILATPIFGGRASLTIANSVEPDYVSDSSKIQNDYFTDIMTRDELLQRAYADEKTISLRYTNILNALDKMHITSGAERVEAAFILKNILDDYLIDKPNSDHSTVFLQITGQINDALFSGNLMFVEHSISQIALTRPALASQLLQTAIRENQDHQSLKLTTLMIIAVNEDSWLRFFNGFSGEIPKVGLDHVPLSFETKFYVPLSEQFNDFKTWLLQSRAEGLLDKSYLNETTRSVHLGYSYQQLSELATNDKVRMTFYFLKEAVKKARSAESIQQTEEVMLDKFADKNYLRTLQSARLAQIEKTWQSNRQTDIDGWDRQYAGTARDQLNQLLSQQPDVNKQLALLLDNRNGLLICQPADTSPDHLHFIVGQMAALKAQGVTTIGLANLRQELTQPLIDDYLATGKITGELATIIRNKSLGSLFSKAYQNGMKIIALDTDSSIKSASGHAVIYQAGAVINSAVETLAQLPQGEKFIAVYDQHHLQSHQGIDSFLPGIAQRMSLPILTVDSSNRFQLAADDLSQRKSCDDVILLPRPIFGNDSYDYQVIIQLSKNTKGIAPLVNKHPGKTVVIHYDIDNGKSHILSGHLQQQSGSKVRWILDELSGYSAAQVYTALKKLTQQQSLTLPQRIVLLGCKLGNNINQNGFHDSFAQDFISEIYADDKNTPISVRAYSTHVDINNSGQRVTHPEQHTRYSWLRESEHRVDLYWRDGLLQSNNIPVILFVVDDIFSKKLSVEQAIQRYSAVLAWGFADGDGVLDKALISQLVDNPTRMEQFTAHIKRALPDPQRWRGSHHLHTAFSEPDRLALGSDSQQNLPFLSGTPLHKWGNIQIAQTSGAQVDNDFNYDYQVIIQLEQEQVVHQSVERLASKHPHKTLVIQYDISSGESRRVYGNPGQLTGSNLRWLLVGHGRRDSIKGINTTIGNATPLTLSRSLKALLAKESLTSPARVVLAGCNLAHAHNGDNFALQLMHRLNKEGINVSIQAYSADMAVDVAGHRLTAGDDPQGETLWLKKNSAHRVNYQLNADGVVMVNEFPAALLIMADIASGKITYDHATQEYTDILKYYFSTADGEVDQLLLTQTVSDPQQFDKFIDYLGTTPPGPSRNRQSFNLGLTTSAGSVSLISENNNIFNELQISRLPEPLEKRINNTLIIMGNLVAGKIKLTELNSDERHYLSDFFQCSDGTLDSKSLMLTVASERDHRAFYHDLHGLLQLADSRMQLNGLSGQDMLQRSKSWNAHLPENIVSLQQAIDKNSVPAVTRQMRITLHTLYLNDGSAEAKRQVTNTGRAWLYALSLGELNQQRFLNGLSTYSEINELQTTENLSESELQQSRQFYQLINELHSSDHLYQYVTDRGRHTLDAWLPQLTGNRPDSYFQLLADNHVFGLARRTTGGQQSWYLYNPDLGEICLTSQHPIKILQVLKTLLYDYLGSKNQAWNNQTLADYYGVQKSGDQLSFVIHEINMTKAADVPALNGLQRLLNDNFSTERQRLKNSGDIKLGTITLPRQTLYEMGASLDGHRVSATLNLPAASLNRLRFDPLVLTRYLAATPQQHTLPALRLLKQFIALARAAKEQILAPHKNADATAEAFTLLDKIEQYKGDEQQLSSQLSPLLNKPAGHHNRWQRINQMTRGAGLITQAYGYYQVLSTLSDYWQAASNKDSGHEELQELALQAGMALGQVSLDIGEYSLDKLSQHLTKKVIHRLAGSGSRLGRLSFTTGIKLAKFGGPLLSIASSGFDIYDAWRYFSWADHTPSPRLRQDMQVHGALSVLSAAVGISTTLAIAAGGTIMSIGGAIGVLMGISLIIAGRAYAAASQIAAIKQYITLSPGEELRSGWLLFTGQGIDISLQDRLDAAHTREEARNSYTRLLKEQAETLLAESLFSKGIDTYFYSKGTFDLKDHTYKKLTGRGSGYRTHGTVIRDMALYYLPKGILKDRILPQQAEAIKQTYEQSINGNRPNYIELSIEDSEYHFYIPTPLKAVKDSINADDNQLGGGAAKIVFQPVQAQDHQQKEMAALFDLHDDDDSVLGYRDKKNVFIVHAGQKQFSGGRLADTFLLMGQPAPSLASELDGGYHSSGTVTALPDDNDIVIASAAPAGGMGYSIDLTKGEVRYLSDVNPLVTYLSHIEHARGHAETDDILTGNQYNNALNGVSGRDELYGNGGNDVLTLAEGYAEGGSGIDTYCILQNLQPKHASIRIKDTASKTEINNIRLHYKAEQISSIELLPDDSVMLTLNNDNGTLTTLILTNIYQLSDTGSQLNRINDYILYTLDGMVLFPQWPQTITRDKQDKWPFSPTLIGQYNPLLDNHWQKEFGEKPTTDIRIQLQRRDSTGRGRITVGDTQMVLPSFIQLATEGTPLNDQLEGDHNSNWLRGYQGNDHLTGKGGSDVYEIYESDGQHKQRYKVTIDNYDDYPSAVNQGGEQQPDTDFLLIKQSVNEIILIQEADDLILSSRNSGNRLPEIRIQNFMSDERNRHLMLIDKSGGNYSLQFNENKLPYLKDEIIQAEPGPDNDYIVLSALAGETVNALAGDDVVVDNTGIGRTLRGGPGNDIMLVTSGDNLLYGDTGDDQLHGGNQSDIISGGSGNDQLSGGHDNDILEDLQGDDVYLFSPGDGQDKIRDLHGTDTLRFLGNEIGTNSLWFKRQVDNLEVLLSAEDSGDSVILEGYFTKSPDNISNIIEVASYQLRGKAIALLAEVMSGFPVFEYSNPSTGIPNAVQKSINELWLEVPPLDISIG